MFVENSVAIYTAHRVILSSSERVIFLAIYFFEICADFLASPSHDDAEFMRINAPRLEQYRRPTISFNVRILPFFLPFFL